MEIRIFPNDTGRPEGKLADAELHFTDGPLASLKLLGFAVWERRTGAGRNVTFPARQYSINGERRSYALLRPTTDTKAQDYVRDLILSAYARYEATNVPTYTPALPAAAADSRETTTPDTDPALGQDTPADNAQDTPQAEPQAPAAPAPIDPASIPF